MSFKKPLASELEAKLAQTEAELAERTVNVETVPLSVVEKLIAEVEELKRANKGVTGEDLREILKSQREAADESTRQSMQTLTNALIRENQTAPEISVFSYPEGDTARPKPRFVDPEGRERETYFCDARQREEQLTPAEIDAFNAIQDDCECRGGSWKARVHGDGKRTILRVNVPCKDTDARMDLPKSLTAILFELKNGKKALDIDQLARQLADMKNQLDRERAKK